MRSLAFNVRPGKTNFYCRLLLAGLTWFTAAAAEDALEEIEVPSLWIKSFDVRMWSGYKDNVLLGKLDPDESPFVAGGLDATFFRLPENGWEYLLIASAEYLRYFSAREVDQEGLAIGQARVQKTFAEDWRASLSAEYLYFNQVFDASTIEEDLFAVKVEGHGLTLRPGIAKDLPRNYRLELEVPVGRQWFAEFIDDYWEFGPKLIFGRDFGRKANLSVSYQFGDRVHDTREARDAQGQVQPDKRLHFYQHDISMNWRQFWDAERRWRTVSKLGLQRNQDNGGGYYDYLRPQFSQQLRYQAATWEVRAEARASYYHYDRQRVGALNSPTRQKAYVRLNCRAEKKLVKSLTLFAEYEHERAISNLDFDEYTVNTLSGGLNWEF